MEFGFAGLFLYVVITGKAEGILRGLWLQKDIYDKRTVYFFYLFHNR